MENLNFLILRATVRVYTKVSKDILTRTWLCTNCYRFDLVYFWIQENVSRLPRASCHCLASLVESRISREVLILSKCTFPPLSYQVYLTFTFYIWIPKVGTSFTIVNINDVTWSNSKSNTFWILIEKVLNIIKSLVKDSFSQLHLARNKTTTNY